MLHTFSRLILPVLLLAGGLFLAPATAEILSDGPAAIVVFPKILIHTNDETGSRLDTFISLSNVSQEPINVLCYYVNATPECDIEGPDRSCFPVNTCSPGRCLPKWKQTDFRFRLTREQPTGWLASVGSGVGCNRSGICAGDGVTECCSSIVNGNCGLLAECADGSRCVTPPCFPLDGDPVGHLGQTNENSAIPPAPEDPFIGELKCIAVDETGAPTDRNDLIGRAHISYVDEDRDYVDVGAYNPIGFPAIDSANNRNLTLVLGGPTGDDPGGNPADAECLAAQPSTCAEYSGCPNILILDHYFDGAIDPQIANICLPTDTCSVTGQDCVTNADCTTNLCDAMSGTCTVTGHPCGDDTACENTCNLIEQQCELSRSGCSEDADCEAASLEIRLTTEITMVPCTQDFEEGQDGAGSITTVQFLVFNEFEQRFSTSNSLDCFKEIPLSNVDTIESRLSIFSAGVGGTLTGQTRMRGVIATSPGSKPGGNALLAVAEEFRCAGPIWEFPDCNYVNTENLVSSAAKNVHFQGRRPQSDYIYLPLQ